jgi:hypothetical protein
MSALATRLRFASALAAFALCAPTSALAVQAGGQASPAPTPAPPPAPPTYVGPPVGSAFHREDFRTVLPRDPPPLTQVYAQALDIARCVQRTHPEVLRELLDKAVSSRAERLAAERVLRSGRTCPVPIPDLSVPTRLLRGAAAEAFLGTIATPEPDVAKVANSTRVADFYKAMPKVDRVRDTTSGDVQTIVECQIILAPGLARKLIESVPGSAESDRLRQHVGDVTTACGTVVTADKRYELIYRTYLAEALYHWTRVGIGNRLT